jgi:molecular chaperone IbpA
MRLTQTQSSTNYPPHNVIKTGDDTVTIEIAVAGFSEGEIDISLDQRLLTVAGNKKRDDSIEPEYLHRGISSRDFKQTFPLAEHVEVNGAAIKDGILTVYLERKIPESAKPKTIAITYTS